MKHLKFLVLALVALAFSCATPAEADQATFTAVAPEYLRYVQADQSLSLEQKQRRIDTVESWRSRAFAAKGVTK